jgi:DNA-binding transcriptional LysR family regulator
MRGKDFDEVATFVEVAHWLSFNKAAHALDVKPSVVSRRVADLETRLKATLLARTTRRVELTEAGELFRGEAEAAIANMDAAYAAVAGLAERPIGRLRVSIPANFGRLHISGLLPEFIRAYPDIELDIQMSDSFVDFVREKLDLAIRIGSIADSRLVAREFLPNHRYLVAAPEYLKRAGVPRHPRDLARHACLLFTRYSEPAIWRLERDGDAQSVRVHGPMRSDGADAPYDAALAGCGIAKVGEFHAWHDLETKRLVRILPGWVAPRSGINFVYRDAKRLAPKVRVFMQFIDARLKARAPWAR